MVEAAAPDAAEGSSNWARVTGDLEMHARTVARSEPAGAPLGGDRSALAARLRTIALEDDRKLGELRELALKCDPQALD